MSFGEVFTRNRQVIPRWHTYPIARWLGVITSLRNRATRRESNADYGERILDWQEQGRISHASDLVGSALVLNNFDDEIAIEAAEFILTKRTHATEPLIELAENFLRLARNVPFPTPDAIFFDEINKYYVAIGNIKKRIKEYPLNPILWMDLAFYYSTIGQPKSAKNAVRVALSLNKENRYLLRSASRFFIHKQTPDIALFYLRRSIIGEHDPWVLAAEIAISDFFASTSKRLKLAQKLVGSKSIPKHHLSELASALGTIEIKNGAHKKGKKLFDIALENPTENVVAQASFLHSRNLFGTSQRLQNLNYLTHSYEAETGFKFRSNDFEGALKAAKKWFTYQPFSSRPAVAASYIASVALGEFAEAARIARMGQLASPGEFMLKNNLAFSLASLGKPEEAGKALERINETLLNESQKSVLTATRGVIKFRDGDVAGGRTYYGTAVDSFKKQRDARAEALATFFWAREENKIGSPQAKRLMSEAQTMLKKNNVTELFSHFSKQN